MLLIVVLGLIAKLALVFSDCDIGTQTLNDFDMNKFADTRPWYWLLHTRIVVEDNLDCPLSIYARPDGNSSSVTLHVYDKLQRRYVKFTGHAFNWNNTGFDLKLDQQSIWNGRRYVIAVDYKHYFIVKLCSEEVNTVLVHVGFRSTHPDTATLKNVYKILKNNNIYGSKMTRASTDHCMRS